MRPAWLSHPWLLGGVGIALVLILWSVITGSGLVDKLFLPSPAAVWQAGQAQAAQSCPRCC